MSVGSVASPLADVRLKPLATGLLSYVPGVFDWWDRRRPVGNTASADYCRGIWEAHRDHVLPFAAGPLRHVGELGPGASLGCIIAALMDGVQTGVALDAGQYASQEANLRILAELSGDNDHPLRAAVSAAGTPQQSRLRYAAPWSDPTVVQADSLDMIFSHSVMEHVDDAAGAYRACFEWLKPGGVISHKIDHSSHGITRSWNGHYTMPAPIWGLVYGRRPFLLNRLRPTAHLELVKAAGFEIVELKFVVDPGDGGKARVNSMPADDRAIRTMHVIARKPG